MAVSRASTLGPIEQQTGAQPYAEAGRFALVALPSVLAGFAQVRAV